MERLESVGQILQFEFRFPRRLHQTIFRDIVLTPRVTPILNDQSRLTYLGIS